MTEDTRQKVRLAMEYEARRPFSYRLTEEEFIEEVYELLVEKFPALTHDEQTDAISLARCDRGEFIEENDSD